MNFILIPKEEQFFHICKPRQPVVDQAGCHRMAADCGEDVAKVIRDVIVKNT